MIHLIDYELSGASARRLMRMHGVTIRDLATRYSLTLSRVRQVRTVGARGFTAVEWQFMITGKWVDLDPRS